MSALPEVEGFRLSPMQEGLLFHALSEPRSRAYHVQMIFAIDGPLDAEAFAGAWRYLFRRHDILRTIFHHDDVGRPLQSVLHDCAPELTIEDGPMPPAWAERDRERGFDLAHEPPMRLALFRLGDTLHHLVWSYHHLLLDGWCLGILQHELLAAYDALRRATRPALPPARQFRCYIDWLARRDADTARDHWQRELEGFERATGVPPLALPNGSDALPRERALLLDRATTAALRRLAASLPVTLSSVVEAAWGVLLSLYNDTDDVLFGCVVSGRPPDLDGAERIVGPFINTIPLRIRMAHEQTVAGLLRAVQWSSLGAQPHHHAPLAEIQALTHLGVALFDHLLVFDNYPEGDGGPSPFSIREIETGDRTHYPFSLVVVPAEELRIKFLYDARLYDEEQVARTARHFDAVLRAIAANPAARVSAIPILPADERERVLHDFRGRRPAWRDERTVVDLIDEQTAAAPDALAVVCAEERLTYRELGERAGALASRLAAEEPVAVFLDRIAAFPVALLGIARAGAAFLPIDIDHPPERVAYILRDSGARVVVTMSELRARLPDGMALICLDDPETMKGHNPATPSRATPGGLAYILYTSGSTGTPKGCLIEHRQLAHYLRWANGFYFQRATQGSFGLFTSPAFDLSMTALFLPLLRGRTVHLFPAVLDPAETLAAVFCSGEINCVKLTPSHVDALAQLDLRSSPIEVAILGGEAVTAEHARTLFRLNPAMRVFNEYGPTEATVGCVVHEVRAGEERIPIGRPIDGFSVYVLDRHLRPAPLGVTGELVLAGPSVARGYLHDDTRTNERFLDDPFEPGRRMYRSGDLGRWLPGGELELLGRRDDQIKIRGQRIEPREVEEALHAVDGVRRAVVLARAGRLIAWLEGEPIAGDDAALRDALRRRLPEAMIPAAFVRMAALPMTLNGKIDRARLHDPADDARAPGAIPRDALDEQLLAVCREVLERDDLGLGDNFLASGGYSLTAMQVVSRVHRRLGVRLPLRDFLAAPALADAAALIRAATPSPYAAIEPSPHRETYELSHAQHRLWLLHQLGGGVAYNMPKAFTHEGALDLAALRGALATVIARHETLRTAFVVRNGEPRQSVLERADADVRLIDVRDEAAAARIAEQEALTPFDLESPPLIRLTALRLAERRFVLLLTMHHIVGDGWSLNVLYREIAALYAARRRRAPDTLPPLRIQYKDFAAWQNASDLGEHEAYWISKLRGAPESLRLPYDRRPADGDRSFRGSIERARLGDASATALRELAIRRGTTLSNVVLTSFAAVLFAFTRQEDFCIGVSTANRDDPDVEPLIGFFVNILPFRVLASPSMSFHDLLRQIGATADDAFAHRDYPFDLLVRRLNPGRHANRQPLLNVVYGFQNFAGVHAAGAPAEAGTDLEDSREFPVSFRTSKFDLCLFVSEIGDTLLLEIEFDSDLFLPPTIRLMLESFERCARTASADAPLTTLGTADALERDAIVAAMRAINDTAAPLPVDATVHRLFLEQAAATPDAVAVMHGATAMTYAELARRSAELARFLVAHGVAEEHFVCVLLDRTPEVIVAILAILRAGAAYVPLGPDMPYERLRGIVADTGARMLVTSKRHITTANRLQWDCPELAAFLCVDSDGVHGEIEQRGGMMAPEIWDYVAEEAFDDISGGGWKSSYTGEWLSREVMDEYGENIRRKLAPRLTPASRVLEIGCATGISMFRLAPLVARYVGTDLSPAIVAWSEREAGRRGLSNVRLAALAAHEIDRLGESGFDVVVLNSVIECFTGHNYLRDVLRKSIALLGERGSLFLGNLWDQDRKGEFVQSLLDFRRANPEAGRRAKIDRGDDLFIARAFLEDLRFDFPEIAAIEFSTMIGSAESELSRFGYDALITIDKRRASARPAARHRSQFDRRDVAACAAAGLPARGGPGTLAYLMYTSGTSGQPKGVMIEHRSIVRLVRNAAYISFGPQDRVLQAGALGFDASTFEIWGPLPNGGAVVLAESESFLRAASFRRTIESNGVTALFLTGSLFNQITEEDPTVFRSLNTLLVGGEKLSPRHVNAVRAANPSLQLKNGYGPTENTTFSTWYDIVAPQERDVPIGRPIGNSTAWILDGGRDPVVPGMPGELCVGGVGLARGYWNRPELTKEKFIAHPFQQGERLYRTGDLVRQLPSGDIEFIGRTDNEVKVRGFRIELEEIESHLLRHPLVAEAAVVTRDAAGGKELIAFAAGGDGLEAAALREHLHSLLPEAMTPSRFVIREKLPLNASGKVDRAALASASLAATAHGEAVDAVTPSEEKLAEIWRRVLERDDVGVTSDFFELGGHSLKVARLASMMARDLGVELPLAIIFRWPTIRQLAAYIDELSRVDRRLLDDALVTMNRHGGSPQLFAFPPGSGYCLAYTQLAEEWPSPFHGFAFIEDDDRLERYVSMIRRTGVAPHVLFGYSGGGKLAFRVAQALESASEPVRAIVMFDSARYLRPVRFSDEEIRGAASEFLRGITSEVLRERALRRIRSYREFLGMSVERGTVRADIHLVTAADSTDVVCGDDGTPVATLPGWSELTSGRFQLRRGSGRHREMLEAPHLRANVALLREIVRPGQ
jgi:amino acid adenylation domain-containing protein